MKMDSLSSFKDTSSVRSKLFGHRRIAWLSSIEAMIHRFSPGERLILYVLTAILSLSALALLAGANAAVSLTVPTRGGELTEGLVGSARFINPLLALTEPDRDITELVYSGLMRVRPDGNLVPDLAASYSISEDGKTYTFKLRENLTFHDGAPLTSADVLFTVQKAQTSEIRSVRRADWDGVSVSTPDEHTVVFTLPRAYTPFIENTTVGILPRHLWQDVSAEDFPFNTLNTHPIGSGPYRAAHSETNSTGAITRFELVAFNDFPLGEAFLKRITFLFYPNEEARITAFNAGKIDALAGIAPKELSNIKRPTSVVRAPLPRVFGVFFNQNKNPVLADPAVREALDAALNKEAIVGQILGGYGTALSGPIPPGSLGNTPPATPEPLIARESETSASVHAAAAQTILSEAEWAFNETGSVWTKKDQTLSFTLATADEPELVATAEALKKAWEEAGIKVELHMYPVSELNSLVLRPRNYDAVLFGEVVGRTLDLFAFWHSSQRNDPGLNLSLYTNSKVDDVLAEARTTTDRKQREKLYEQFSLYVEEDKPAVFLYAPQFIYVVPENLQGIELGALTSPEERFASAYEWYTDQERVWNIFTSRTE